MVKKKDLDLDYPYIRLTYSWDMVLCLLDFIDCIKLHKSDLKSSRNLSLMKYQKDFYNDENFNPGGVLKDYLYLEASSFFKYAKELKLSKNDKNIPELPLYIDELEDFRNVFVAHRDRKEKLRFPNDWVAFQLKISKSIPIATLVKDVNECYLEVVRRYEEFLRNR